MMKKWKVVAPLALTAAGALAAGAAVLLRKPAREASPAPGSGKAAAKAAPAPSQTLKTGSYSFISGYRDAATVELSLRYDLEQFSFDVIGEDFLSYSSDSHVAVVYGVDFNLQIEYAGYYSGEDWQAHSKAVAAKFKGCAPAEYGMLKGILYLDGDNVCFNFPIENDPYSYLLVTAMKTPEYDDEVSTLPDYAPLALLLESVSIGRR